MQMLKPLQHLHVNVQEEVWAKSRLSTLHMVDDCGKLLSLLHDFAKVGPSCNTVFCKPFDAFTRLCKNSKRNLQASVEASRALATDAY